MTPSADTHDAQLDELYGLPLERFTPERDELARRLRKEGDRARADRVKGLRKPSVVAWALNQVRRHDRERVEQLLAAGGRLREAQQQLLAGGDHGLLRDAVADERSLLEDVARLAEQQLARAGHSTNANLQNKLWQTLHAAARDDQTRELLSIGRLVREGQITDFGLGAMEIDLTAVEAAPDAAATAPTRPNARLERKVKAAQRRIDQARSQQHELEEKLADLERRAADAGREAARAASDAERAQSSAERARAKARAAAERTNELEAALAELGSEA